MKRLLPALLFLGLGLSEACQIATQRVLCQQATPVSRVYGVRNAKTDR